MSTSQPPPYRGAYWVVPGELLAGPYPVSPDDENMDTVLTALLDAGIRSVIDLMENEEVDNHEEGVRYPHYEDRMEALAEERGHLVEIQRHAIAVSAPPTEEELELIVEAIDAEVDGRNSPTLVHCSDGHGRTGLIIGCYLARHGIANGKAVIKKIRELRAFDPELAEHKSPDNIVQERIVTRWKEGQ